MPGGPPSSQRRGIWQNTFLVALLVIAAVGLSIRVAYVMGWKDVDSFEGDPYYYHAAANLLADGEGFVHPYAWDEGVRVAGADHPPGYVVLLAVPSLLGFDSVRAHQITSCLVGAGTILLIGLVGRRLAGDRAGLIAAGLAAVYPNMWLNDGALMSETLALFLVAAATLAAYWAWDGPTWRRFAALGATVGLASLARAEGALLLGLVVVPLAAWVPGLAGWRERARHGLAAVAMALLVMAPWVVANLVRFEEPATLSTQLGPTLDVANCDDTYEGPLLGAWSFACATEIEGHDRSVLDRETRQEAQSYVGDHLDRVPAVVAARFGRTWGLYDPFDQLELDFFADGRPLNAARVGLGMYYAGAVAAMAGLVALRRRGVPSFPVTAWLVNVAITVVVFYGSTRFRAPAEPALVLLAAVGVDAGLRRWRSPADPAPVSLEEDGPTGARDLQTSG
jgi:4-amino-4-deoxy-L-arabinose transferase-like glycosyltransferase